MKKIHGKRGVSKLIIIGGIIILIGVIFALFYGHNTCLITPDLIDRANINEGNSLEIIDSKIAKLDLWFSDHIFLCQSQSNDKFESTTLWIKNALGFDETVYEFFYPALVTGLLAGFFIFLSYELIFLWTEMTYAKAFLVFKDQAQADKAKLQSSWLNFIGSSPIKIILIGVIYAILMQIPILNTFISIITLAVPPFNFPIILQALLIALYIGFIPGAIEAYTRYKMRMYYYSQIVMIKYGAKMLKSASEA
ncbi:hypothetical protein COU57_06265 [Candidatus Pacearchaeota archaeon CG10_big_fil_rev_8_21_14_0_10_32_14]|nr:MAG: hypothetical protein COU57_06265 [Candidatus Pacearchaeota archaeon CG10_big_fil_rev_8_21_14_0_10_32_14]